MTASMGPGTREREGVNLIGSHRELRDEGRKHREREGEAS